MSDQKGVNEDGKIDVEEKKNKDQAIEPGNEPAKNENMIPKARFNQIIQQKNEMEESLKSVAAELVQDIPEEYRSLVPDVGPKEQITWIRQAQKSGIFNKQTVESLDTERPTGKKQVDYSNMKPVQKIAAGYNK